MAVKRFQNVPEVEVYKRRKKMKRVGRSKNPLYHQFPLMVKNLREKFNASACINMECWKFEPLDKEKMEYKISLVPGLNGEICTQYTFTSWESLLDHYYFLLKKET